MSTGVYTSNNLIDTGLLKLSVNIASAIYSDFNI